MKEAMFLPALALLAACSSGPSRKSVAFEGRWKMETSSEISGTRTVKDVRVFTDGSKFRREEATREEGFNTPAVETRTTLVYDGETLHREEAVLTPTNGEPPEAPTVSAAKALENDLKDLRFWEASATGETSPGGKIAGRDTVLHQRRVNRPDAEETTQFWVDVETGLLLRKHLSLFSKQVDQTLLKETFECEELKMGPVDAGKFSAP